MDERRDVGMRPSVLDLSWRRAVAWSLVAIFLCGGCGTPSDRPAGPQTPPGPVEQLPPADPNEAPTPAEAQAEPETTAAKPTTFAPDHIEILPLTELVEAVDDENGPQLNVFLSILDAFGSQMKAPGGVRFELYEHVQRSAEPKGQRIGIWSIDLTDPAENNRYWRDFLRAYEFMLTLGTDASKSRTYVLEATFLRPSGRLSTEWLLRPEN